VRIEDSGQRFAGASDPSNLLRRAKTSLDVQALHSRPWVAVGHMSANERHYPAFSFVVGDLNAEPARTVEEPILADLGADKPHVEEKREPGLGFPRKDVSPHVSPSRHVSLRLAAIGHTHLCVTVLVSVGAERTDALKERGLRSP
jgi:hypothetical protein